MSRIPRTLLLTDVPPCDGFSGGLALAGFCRFMPPGSLAVYSVATPGIDARLAPEFAGVPFATRPKPPERVRRVLPGRAGSAIAMAVSLWRLGVGIAPIVSDIARFGRENGSESLWCILQGQTMIRLARPVAQRLRVPLLTWAWDPPGWWMRENGVDRVTARYAVREFGAALRASTAFGAASWAMAERYSAEYGVRGVPVVPGLDERLAVAPAGPSARGTRLIVGMSGQFYAMEEWETLMNVLDRAGWTLAGRPVTVRVLGRQAPLSASGARSIEYLGWRTQRETIAALSEADILYCPYWFSPAFREEAALSFPSKLTTYLAAGRPVLFHGPPDASPARFLERYDAGALCTSPGPDPLAGTLLRLASDASFAERLAVNGARAFAEQLTLARSRERFAGFLGVDPGDLVE
jgi:hypothetical protein